MLLNKLRSRIDELKGIKNNLENKIIEDKVELRLMEEERIKISKCNKVLSFVSQHNQEKIVKFFEHLVSSGLKDLFDESYGFRFDLKTRGDSSAADFEIQSSAFPGWANITMTRGKSVQEIVAVILRLALVKFDNRSRKILILDEPSGGLEPDRQSMLSKFLKDICEKFKIQLIIVTHSNELCAYTDLKVDLDTVK